MGDALADIPVWREARRAIVVGGPRILAAARRVAEVERVFAPGQARLLRLPRALRLHQWVKNLLICLPLLAVHQVSDGVGLLLAVLAFLAFGMTALAVYVLNDLLDLPADRRHPRKRRRPFAAGDLRLAWGLWLIPLLLCWISRLWFKTHRGQVHDDPVVFALRDRVSLLIGILTVGILILASVGVAV